MKHCIFSMICGSRGSKSRLPKAAGAEPSGQMRDEKLHAVVAAKHISKSKCTKHLSLGARLEVEMSKKRTLFVARSKFGSQNVKTHHVRSTLGSYDVQKVHAIVVRSTFQSQNGQNTSASEQTFDETHFEVKCTKHHMFGPLLDVEASFCVAGARHSPPCQK